MTPLGEPTDTNLRNITALVMASSVNDMNCPGQVIYEFPASTASIYVVARAVDIEAGSTISARWSQYGIELTTIGFTTNQDIISECVYVEANPADFAFVPGEYRVDIQIDGEPAGYALDFTIR